MIALDDFLDVMAAFQNKSLSAPVFVDRYFALWDKLDQEQTEAIRRHPEVDARLHQLREMHRTGAITSDDYLETVQAEYGRIQGLSLVPGSTAVQVLDQLFVEADAFRETTTGDDEEEPFLNEQGLHEAVSRALGQLQPE